MKKSTYRSILIDPVTKTITNIEVPCANETLHTHKLIGCDCCGQVSFGDGISLAVNDEGLYQIARESTPPYNVIQGFFVIHTGSLARNLIAGKGVLWAFNTDGETIDLPASIQPALIAQVIKFIPDSKRNDAADLCQEILRDAGITADPAEYARKRRKYGEIVNRALALCQTPSNSKPKTP